MDPSYNQNGTNRSDHNQMNQPIAADRNQQSSISNQAGSYSQVNTQYPSYTPNQTQTQQQPPVSQQNRQPVVKQEDNHVGRMPNPQNEIVAPYIPVIRQIQSSNTLSYILPSDEVSKMLQQNAVIIRKFISDVNRGKLIDLTEYSGLHTSVYLLSLFSKTKLSGSNPSVSITTYQSLIKKMKQVEMLAKKNHPFSVS